MDTSLLKKFDGTDWSLYWGCEGDPEILYTKGTCNGKECELVVVVDDNGINLDYYDNTTGNTHDFQFECSSMAVAKNILSMLAVDNVTVETLQAVGFIYNLV